MRALEEGSEESGAVPNAHGWIQSPGCGIRFSIEDSNAFKEGLHQTCGQKIKVLGGG
jgi:hypothetical protein